MYYIYTYIFVCMFIRKGNPTCEPYGISTIINKMMNTALIQARTKSKKYQSFFSNSVIMSSLTS